MKKLIILICLLAAAIVGYQIVQAALTVSSGSLSVSSGVVNVADVDQLWIDSEGNYFVDSEGNSFIGAIP